MNNRSDCFTLEFRGVTEVCCRKFEASYYSGSQQNSMPYSKNSSQSHIW